MASITFDTLKFVETLESAGVERKQASAIASAVRDSHEAADVATKGDITLLRKDMTSMELGLRKDMKALESRLIIKLSVVMVCLIAFAGTVQVVVSKL